MSLIAASARKLEAYLTFSRVAFGGSRPAETFDARELEKLARGRLRPYARPSWTGPWSAALDKPPARALLNLAQIGGRRPAHRRVGPAQARERRRRRSSSSPATPNGPARACAEVLAGLRGEPLGEGLGGHWVQALFPARPGRRRPAEPLETSAEEGLVAVAVQPARRLNRTADLPQIRGSIPLLNQAGAIAGP